MATLLQLSVPAGFTLFTQFGDERFLTPSLLERGPTPAKTWYERKIVRQKVLIRGFLSFYISFTANQLKLVAAYIDRGLKNVSKSFLAIKSTFGWLLFKLGSKGGQRWFYVHISIKLLRFLRHPFLDTNYTDYKISKLAETF